MKMLFMNSPFIELVKLMSNFLVIFILCGMAELAFKKITEVKLFAEVWKCILSIVCTGKLPKSVVNLTASQGELICMEFLSTAVKTCCFCLQNSVQQLGETEVRYRNLLRKTFLLQ